MASFRDITGSRKAVIHLKRAILADRVSHAYLICGDSSSEKQDLAEAFAQTLQCTTLDSLLHTPSYESDDAGAGARRSLPETPDFRSSISPDAIDACGTCRSCIQAKDHNQPDLLTWTHDKPKTFSVEDARRLVDDIQIRPFNSTRKVYIIPDAHLMNTEAQNTLLKTLEEPPEYAVLILLADSADMMLETIRSRCVILELDSTGHALTEDALSLAMNILLNVRDWTLPEILEAVRELSEYKLTVGDFTDLFTSWYRDILYVKATDDTKAVLHKDYTREIQTAASLISYEGIRKILDAIETAGARLRANVNFELTMELLLLAMKES